MLVSGHNQAAILKISVSKAVLLQKIALKTKIPSYFHQNVVVTQGRTQGGFWG